MRKCRESRIDLLAAAGIEHSDLQSHRAHGGLRVLHRRLGCWISGRIDEHRDTSRCGYQFAQDFQSLGYKFDREKIDPRDIAARPREAGNQTEPDRIIADIEDDGDGRGCRLGRQRRGPVATMTETGLRASSPASIGSRSSWFSAQRYSIILFYYLFYYDLVIGAVAALLFIPIINHSYMRHALMLNEGLNNQLEQEVQVIEAAREGAVTRHFAEVRAWRVKLSDADALNWTAIEGLSILVFLLVLLRVTYMPNADVGTIFAIFVYVWRLMEKLDMMPQIVQQLMGLKDIRRRIDAGASIETIGEQIQRTGTEKIEPS